MWQVVPIRTCIGTHHAHPRMAWHVSTAPGASFSLSYDVDRGSYLREYAGISLLSLKIGSSID